MKLHTLTIAACFILLIGSCSENETTKSIIGFKPVYGGIEDIQKLITTTTAQPLKSVGKIYTYGNLLLINEVGKGVHVYDNQDPSAPVNLKFIAIPGNVDVALKDGYLYADLNFGIITLDISDLDHVTLTHLNTEYKGNSGSESPCVVYGKLSSLTRHHFCFRIWNTVFNSKRSKHCERDNPSVE